MSEARMRVGVRTYSGHRADERPVSLTIGSSTVDVKEVLDRWYGPDHSYFKIEGANGRIYVIRHDECEDEWELIVMEDPGSGP